MNPSLKDPPIVLSGNRAQAINRQKMAWSGAKNKAAWLQAKKNLTHYQQERYNWRFSSEEEHGKRVIHGTPHIRNDNTCSWTMTNMINNTTSSDVVAVAAIASTVFACPSQRKSIPCVQRSPAPNEFGKRVIQGKPHTWNNNRSWKLDAIPDSDFTPEDAATATAIATAIASSTTFTSSTTNDVILIIGQKTAGAALAAASAAVKAIKLPTTIEDDGGTIGTATTEITQNQANETYRIQAILYNHATSIEGMSSYFSKL